MGSPDLPKESFKKRISSLFPGILGQRMQKYMMFDTPTLKSAGEITFSYSDLSVNQHNITMTVTDEVGATCTTATNYTAGTPPSITIDGPLPSWMVVS